MKFRMRFSLRNLLLFTVVSSILFMVVGLPYAEYRRQLVIANRLEERGCWVEWRPRTKNWGADFFSDVGLGRGYLRINGIEFKESWSTTNDDLSELTSLEHLSWLAFKDSSINDEGLVRLNKFPSLTYLDLEDNVSITDAGLKRLTLTDLSSLNVDGTSVTYDGLNWIAKQNPLLDKETLIGRHAIAKLKQMDFRCHVSVASESKLQPRDSIGVGQHNSGSQWRDAAEHLREFPELVIYQFRDLPQRVGPEYEWGLTLSIAVLGVESTIRSSDIRAAVRNNTIPAVAVIPPLGTAVSRLSGPGEIRAWFGEPDWPAKVGENTLEIPMDAEIVFVDAASLPVTVEVTQDDLLHVR